MRSCIIETTRENRPIIEAHLPTGVFVFETKEPFECDGQVLLKLRGNLPAWCERQEGEFIIRATAEIMADGTMQLSPGAGTLLQQIHPRVKE